MKRTALSLCLVICAGAAGAARAGTLSSLTSASSCANPLVASAMAPVDYFVDAGPKVCKSLCKSAAAQCKGYVKGSASCALASYKSENRYRLENCVLVSATPADLKACRDAVNADYKSLKTEVHDFAPGQLEACGQWGRDCAAACSGAPL